MVRIREIFPGVTEKEYRRIERCFPRYNVLFLVKDRAGSVLDWDADLFGTTIPLYIQFHVGKAAPSWDYIQPYLYVPGVGFTELPKISRAFRIIEGGPLFKGEPVLLRVQREAYELFSRFKQKGSDIESHVTGIWRPSWTP